MLRRPADHTRKPLQKNKQKPTRGVGGHSRVCLRGWGGQAAPGGLAQLSPWLWQRMVLVLMGLIWVQAWLAGLAGLVMTPGESEMLIKAVLNGKFVSDLR